MAVVQGVGYPNPNRSHFRSTEIWQTAADSDRNMPYGWLGQYFDNCCQGAPPTVGVAIGGQMPQAFTSPHPDGHFLRQPGTVSLDRPAIRPRPAAMRGRALLPPDQRARATRRRRRGEDMSGGSIGAIAAGGAAHARQPRFARLPRTHRARRAAFQRQGARNRAQDPVRRRAYPNSKLADSLSLVARMIAGGLPTRVYYVSHGGYDTHQGQATTHERLMKEFGDGAGRVLRGPEGAGEFQPRDGDDFQRVRPARGAKRQRRDGPRRGGADVHFRRRGEARHCTGNIRA